MKKTSGNSSEATGTEINNATTLHVAEETRNTFSAGDNRACSDRRSREDEYSDGMTAAEDRVGTMQPICYGDRQREKLLRLWGIQSHGLALLK